MELEPAVPGRGQSFGSHYSMAASAGRCLPSGFVLSFLVPGLLSRAALKSEEIVDGKTNILNFVNNHRR